MFCGAKEGPGEKKVLRILLLALAWVQALLLALPVSRERMQATRQASLQAYAQADGRQWTSLCPGRQEAVNS